MKLSRTVAYAVQATLLLAQTNSDAPVPCSQLASEGRMPERFLLQVLRHLVTHGILRSTRGVDGGYALDRRPDDISLLDVIEAIDGPFGFGWPAGEGIVPATGDQKIRKALDQVAAQSRRQLQAIKIADLLAQPSAAGMA